MNIEQIKDRTLTISSIARRIYGMKLILQDGPSDASTWFLFNREKLNYRIKFKSDGLILDIGSYLGDYTKKVLARNPGMTFWLYELNPEYFNACLIRFKDGQNVTVYQKAVNADGRYFQMQIDGLRSRLELNISYEVLQTASIGIQEIFDSVSEIELLKLNIEGMEYECLDQLVRSESLVKARHLLIQFHNFEGGSKSKRDVLRSKISKDFNNIYTFDWMWELWIRKDE